jgi:hypothetical protein
MFDWLFVLSLVLLLAGPIIAVFALVVPLDLTAGCAVLNPSWRR